MKKKLRKKLRGKHTEEVLSIWEKHNTNKPWKIMANGKRIWRFRCPIFRHDEDKKHMHETESQWSFTHRIDTMHGTVEGRFWREARGGRVRTYLMSVNIYALGTKDWKYQEDEHRERLLRKASLLLRQGLMIRRLHLNDKKYK